MKRATALILASAAMMSIGAAAIATGHTAKYDSTVTAKLNKGGKEGGSFSGTVESATLRCAADRDVNVQMRVDNAPDVLVGSDATDDTGAWELPVTADLAPGAYYAAAAKKTLKKNTKHRHVCKRALSAEVVVK